MCLGVLLLLQNAEDNQYEDSVQPTLEFALTTQDITGCGAQETLLVFNNEVGFSRQNMESICSVGRSTKKGRRSKGFIGEKGDKNNMKTFYFNFSSWRTSSYSVYELWKYLDAGNSLDYLCITARN